MGAEAHSNLSVDEVLTNSQQSEEFSGSGRARSCLRPLLCILGFVLALSVVAVLGHVISRDVALRSRTVDLLWDMPDVTAVLLVGAEGCQWREVPMSYHSGNVYRCDFKPSSKDESKYFIRAGIGQREQLYESAVAPLGNSKRVEVAFQPSWAMIPVVFQWAPDAQTFAGHQAFVEWKNTDFFFSSHLIKPSCPQHQWCAVANTAPGEITMRPTLFVPRYNQVLFRLKYGPLASAAQLSVGDVTDFAATKWDKTVVPTPGLGVLVVVTLKRGDILSTEQRSFVPATEFVLNHGASVAVAAKIHLGGAGKPWREVGMKKVAQRQPQASGSEGSNSSGSGSRAATQLRVETVVLEGESLFFVRGKAEEGGTRSSFESVVRHVGALPQIQLTFEDDWKLFEFHIQSPVGDMEAGTMYYVQWRDSGGLHRGCRYPQNEWYEVQKSSGAGLVPELTLTLPRLNSPDYRLGFRKLPQQRHGQELARPPVVYDCDMEEMTTWHFVPIHALVQACMRDGVLTALERPISVRSRFVQFNLHAEKCAHGRDPSMLVRRLLPEVEADAPWEAFPMKKGTALRAQFILLLALSPTPHEYLFRCRAQGRPLGLVAEGPLRTLDLQERVVWQSVDSSWLPLHVQLRLAAFTSGHPPTAPGPFFLAWKDGRGSDWGTASAPYENSAQAMWECAQEKWCPMEAGKLTLYLSRLHATSYRVRGPRSDGAAGQFESHWQKLVLSEKKEQCVELVRDSAGECKQQACGGSDGTPSTA